MVLAKRYCLEYVDGTIECFRDGGFWYTTKGQIIKWSILGSLFGLFMLWFIGGYIHAKRRMKKGKPLLAYHRFLVSYQERTRYNQTPQNHFAFYAAQNPQAYPNNRPPYQQRADGSWPEPPPLYNGGDAPPGYFAPPGASKANPNQSGAQTVEMPMYGAPVGGQQSGVVGGSAGDVEQGRTEELPPRPPQKVKAVLKGFTDRFRK
ncbi:hypothetical protein N0V95_003035 [Ascochyta clinopodiicola]|nr:hypothetical protein N0V95_003035 [Ascochyta clinopodiicola]